MIFWSQKLAQTYDQCLEFAITAHFNSSFLLTLALKTRTCIITLLIPAWLKFNPNLIEIPVPYKFSMGAWSGIGANTVHKQYPFPMNSASTPVFVILDHVPRMPRTLSNCDMNTWTKESRSFKWSQNNKMFCAYEAPKCLQSPFQSWLNLFCPAEHQILRELH